MIIQGAPSLFHIEQTVRNLNSVRNGICDL